MSRRRRCRANDSSSSVGRRAQPMSHIRIRILYRHQTPSSHAAIFRTPRVDSHKGVVVVGMELLRVGRRTTTATAARWKEGGERDAKVFVQYAVQHRIETGARHTDEVTVNVLVLREVEKVEHIERVVEIDGEPADGVHNHQSCQQQQRFAVSIRHRLPSLSVQRPTRRARSQTLSKSSPDVAITQR